MIKGNATRNAEAEEEARAGGILLLKALGDKVMAGFRVLMSNIKKRTQCGTNQMPRAGSEVWTSGLKRKACKQQARPRQSWVWLQGKKGKAPKRGLKTGKDFRGQTRGRILGPK